MGVGNWKATRGAGGTRGAPGERESLGNPRGGSGVAPGLRLGGQRVSPEPWGEGSGPSQERAGGES